MGKENVIWFDNTRSKENIKRDFKTTLFLSILGFLILFPLLVLINPMGGSKIPGLIMSIFVPSFFWILYILGQKLHPNKAGFSKLGLHLKRDSGKEKVIPWRKVIKVTDDGKRVIYSSLWLYGAGLPQQMFSEARLNVLDYWKKYKEYRENNPKYRLKEKKQDLKTRKKQVAAVFIAILVSIVTNVWMYFNTPFYEVIISFVGGTILLAIVLVHFLNKYRSLKAEISEMKENIRKQ